MRYKVRHVSKLSYAAPVARARFNLRLRPRLRQGQTLLEESLALSPEPSSRLDEEGPYWVTTTRIGFDAPLSRIEVTSDFVIDITAPHLPSTSRAGPTIAAVRSEALEAADLSALAPAPYLFASRIVTMSDEITAWAAPHLAPDADIIAAASALMETLHAEFTFAPGATDPRTLPEDAFAERRGVCQDFTHVMSMALRAHGIPAAYVSGYLLTRPPPGKPKLVGADAMHAWVDVWCGRELGWVGFDPTNNCLAGEDHIAIGLGRDYADVSPIDGTFIGSAPQSMTSAVDVERVE
jgi:transglutaminase-like putative cysteine protease